MIDACLLAVFFLYVWAWTSVKSKRDKLLEMKIDLLLKESDENKIQYQSIMQNLGILQTNSVITYGEKNLYENDRLKILELLEQIKHEKETKNS